MKKTTKATTTKAKKAPGTKKRAGTTRASDPGAATERVKKTRGRVVDCGGGIRQRLDHDERGSPVLVIWRVGRGEDFAC